MFWHLLLNKICQTFEGEVEVELSEQELTNLSYLSSLEIYLPANSSYFY